jgi:endonuclease V-like protein UPF0215 family
LKPIRRTPSSDDYSVKCRGLFRNEAQPYRAVGIDDGPSTRNGVLDSHNNRASIIAVWFDRLKFDEVLIGVAQVDGLDSTDVILRLLKGKRTAVLFLSGASFAGFNIVDARRLHKTLHIPIIIISREKPDNASVKRALRKHFPDWKTRWELIRRLGRIHAFAPRPSEQPLHFESIGISPAQARRIILAYCVTSRVPEPVRVAGIMAKGLALTGRELPARRQQVGNAELQRLKVHYGEQTRRRN